MGFPRVSTEVQVGRDSKRFGILASELDAERQLLEDNPEDAGLHKRNIRHLEKELYGGVVTIHPKAAGFGAPEETAQIRVGGTSTNGNSSFEPAPARETYSNGDDLAARWKDKIIGDGAPDYGVPEEDDDLGRRWQEITGGGALAAIPEQEIEGQDIGGFGAAATKAIGGLIAGGGRALSDYGLAEKDNTLTAWGQELVLKNPTTLHGFADITKDWSNVNSAAAPSDRAAIVFFSAATLSSLACCSSFFSSATRAFSAPVTCSWVCPSRASSSPP